MAMQTEAKIVFLAECTAMSLKQADEMEGGLASTLQKRHKIRDTDLQTIFQKTDALEPGTFAKIYMAFQLMLYSGASYKDFKGLLNAASGGLAAVNVTPHWHPGRTYALGDIYEYEPMNLFPGWSLTNLRNSRYMLDPHTVLEYPDQSIATDLHGRHLSGSKASTGGMDMARRLSQPDLQRYEKRIADDAFAGRVRRNSVYSDSLDRNKVNMENRLGNIAGDIQRDYAPDVAVRKFTRLERELRETTLAGSLHYDQLLHSLNLHVGMGTDYARLVDAKLHWNQHRDAMINYICRRIVELGKPSVPGESVTMPRG